VLHTKYNGYSAMTRSSGIWWYQFLCTR